ncbi:MAG: hypothetical protein SF162_01390 [bacterium]|nr:hypothetical protein [bacterium]
MTPPPILPPAPKSNTLPSFGITLLMLVAALVALFTILILFALHPPPQTGLARAALYPADCAAPCFVGIRPGVTTLDQALAILSQHHWFTDVTVEERRHMQSVHWLWSGTQPSELASPHPIAPPFITVVDGVVRFIYIPTRIAYGDVWRWFGAPDSVRTAMNGRASMTPNPGLGTVDHISTYLDHGFEVEVTMTCPFAVEPFWKAETVFIYSAVGTERPDTHPFDDAAWIARQPC